MRTVQVFILVLINQLTCLHMKSIHHKTRTQKISGQKVNREGATLEFVTRPASKTKATLVNKTGLLVPSIFLKSNFANDQQNNADIVNDAFEQVNNFDVTKLANPLLQLKKKGFIFLKKTKKSLDEILKSSLASLTSKVKTFTPQENMANAASTVGGVLAGTSTLVNGINNGNWVEIITGGLGIISGVAPLFGTFGPLVGAIFSFLSGFFSFFTGFVSPSQPPKESQEEMVHRVITAALQDSHIDQLKREIKGVQNLYRSLASSVSNFRARIMDENQIDETDCTETQKKKSKTQTLSTVQGVELYSRAFSEITKLGILQDFINEYCEVGDFNNKSDQVSEKCNTFVRLYSSLSIQRQLTLIDMATLLNEGEKKLKQTALNLMDIIRDEQIQDRIFLRFLYEPLSYLNRRYAVSYIFDHPEENQALLAYLKLLDKLSTAQSPVIGCSSYHLQGVCTAIENGALQLESYKSVFVPSGQTIFDITYSGYTSNASSLHDVTKIGKSVIAIVLPYLKKEYFISFDMNINPSANGNIIALYGSNSENKEKIFMAPAIEIVKDGITFITYKEFSISNERPYHAKLKNSSWYNVAMSQKLDNEKYKIQNKVYDSSYLKNYSYDLEKKWVLDYNNVRVFVSDTNPSKGFIKNLLIRSGGYFIAPLEKPLKGILFEHQIKNQGSWTLKFDIKIYRSNEDTIKFVNLTFEFVNTTENMLIKFQVQGSEINVTENNRILNGLYTDEWINCQIKNVLIDNNKFKLTFVINERTLFSNTTTVLKLFSKMTVDTENEVGLIRQFSIFENEMDEPLKGDINSDVVYKGPSTFNNIMDIGDLNGHFFNTPISKYRVNIRKTSDDTAILNDVRFCNAERDCRWYGVTNRIVEAKKHIYASLQIASILIPQKLVVSLYDKNEILTKVFYGPDFIENGCIPQQSTKFKIETHNKTIKIAKICGEGKCLSLILPEQNQTLFVPLWERTLSCGILSQNISFFSIPEGVALTFYVNKNSSTTMGPFTGPTSVYDKNNYFKNINITKFNNIKIESTDRTVLQVCSGPKLTVDCVYFDIVHNKEITQLPFSSIKSMKIPEGTSVEVSYVSHKRIFHQGVVDINPTSSNIFRMYFSEISI